jgi:hypothetical protein
VKYSGLAGDALALYFAHGCASDKIVNMGTLPEFEETEDAILFHQSH